MKRISNAKAHSIIHTSAALHGTVAFGTAKDPTLVGGDALLTAITFATLGLLAKEMHLTLSDTVIESFVHQQLAQYMGINGTKTVMRYIPVAGELINGGVSLVTTEAICWKFVNKYNH